MQGYRNSEWTLASVVVLVLVVVLEEEFLGSGDAGMHVAIFVVRLVTMKMAQWAQSGSAIGWHAVTHARYASGRTS